MEVLFFQMEILFFRRQDLQLEVTIVKYDKSHNLIKIKKSKFLISHSLHLKIL